MTTDPTRIFNLDDRQWHVYDEIPGPSRCGRHHATSERTPVPRGEDCQECAKPNAILDFVNVTGCLHCPFETYTGGGHECAHPNALCARADRFITVEEGRMPWCPLEKRPVRVQVRSLASSPGEPTETAR